MRNAASKLLFNTLMLGMFLSLGSCRDNLDVDLDQIAINTDLQRFDQAFFEADTTNFEQMISSLSKDYSPFFSSKSELIFWQNQRRDPLQQELYEKVSDEFGEMGAFEFALNEVLKRYYYYFGISDTLQMYSYISRLDFNYPVVFASPYIFIASDLYLGESGEEYYASLPQYLQFERQAYFLVRDVAYALAASKIEAPQEPASLLETMVYHGKVLYLTERLYPQLKEDQLLKYPPKKWKFSLEHEKEMWVYFIENELLFKSSQEVNRRFIDVAPFSKFRTQIDQETPGRIGRWFGYKIFKAYAEEAEGLDLQSLLGEKDARKILKLSGYKP